MFGSLPRVPPQKCRFERPLAERRKTGTDPVKPLDTLFGSGGFVNSGGRPRIRRGPCALLACDDNTRPRLRQHRTGLPRR